MITFLIILLPFIVYGAKNSWGHTENKVEDWVPKRFEETKQLLEFGRIFQANEILLISWDDCTLVSPETGEYNPQLKAFKDKLLAPQKVSDGTEKILFNQVVTGQDVFELLSREEMRLEEAEILERLKGFLISKDYQKTCLIAMLSQDGRTYRPDAINGLWDIAKSIDGIDMNKFHAAGPSLDSVAIDKMSRTYLIEMNAASYLIGIFISYLCFRSIRAALLVFFVSFMNQQMCLALIYWLNIQFDSILMLSVNLTFVLSMSAGIHLTNYYRDAITRHEPRDAVFVALKTALVPTFISVITTIAGLLSFLSSQLIPIRKFGTVSSTALAASVIIILIFLPIYYIAFPIKTWQNQTEKKPSKWDLSNIIERMFYPWVSRSAYMVLALSLLITVVCFWGAMRLKTSIGLHSMLRSYTQPICDYTWVENEFGPLIPVEVMLTWSQGEDSQIFDRLCFVRKISERIKGEMSDIGVISITNFLPDIPESGTRAAAFRRVFNRKIDTAKEGFTQSGYFKEMDGNQYWRITVRTFAMRRIDYGPIIQQIKDIVKEELALAESKMQNPAQAKSEIALSKGLCISTTASGSTDVIAVDADTPIAVDENAAPISGQEPDNPFVTEQETDSAESNSEAKAAIPVDSSWDSPAIVVDGAAESVIETPVETAEPEENSSQTLQTPSGSDSKPIPAFTTPSFIVTGGVPVVYKAQNQLLTDLKLSFLTAFGIIGLILVCLFRSFRCGTLAVYPSLLPVIFVFGIVGWLGLRVEMGTMLTGSAALGIAVDNTVHFITWYRLGHLRGMSRKESVQLAYRKCGVAMFQTSSVCSFGLVTYMVSPFIPTIYFSFFMCALLFAALISDLTVLPAILFTAAGGIFLRSIKKQDESQE